MARVSRTIDLPGPMSATEDLWYDLRRRRSFFDGFGIVAKLEGPWPQRGARILWDSPPRGRGRVAETVEAYEARSGQTVGFEDEKLRGTQRTTFAAAADDQVRVTVALDWSLKEGNAITDWVFVRRAMGESLRQTLVRYRIERLADLDDERASAAGAP